MIGTQLDIRVVRVWDVAERGGECLSQEDGICSRSSYGYLKCIELGCVSCCFGWDERAAVNVLHASGVADAPRLLTGTDYTYIKVPP